MSSLLPVTNKQKCPICKSQEHKLLLDLPCGRFDSSTLYTNARILTCETCGHVFNRLSDDEYSGLIRYYNEEYSVLNLQSTDKTGDRPGSSNSLSRMRFEQLYKFAKEHLKKDMKILDVGCAMGGLLNVLKENDHHLLYGIDLTENYINAAKEQNPNLNLRVGSAEKIPFEENVFDFIFEDQVLEHLLEPQNAFSEAFRVLKPGGYFCLGVPDASKYSESYIFDFYWFIMREHIQHFDVYHLQALAMQNGFELITHITLSMPMMSDTMMLPNLNILFRKLDQKQENSVNLFTSNHFLLNEITSKYIKEQFSLLERKQAQISTWVNENKYFYIWGIGREFLYLWENTDLADCQICGLLDSNPYKQKALKIDGVNIQSPAIIRDASPLDSLLIPATSHAEKISEAATASGFRGPRYAATDFHIEL